MLLFMLIKKFLHETMENLKKAFNKDEISVKPNGILDNLNFTLSK